MVKRVLPAGNDYYVEARNLGEQAAPVTITQSEFMRRFKEMSAISGNGNYYGQMPDAYNIIVNMESPVIAKIWADKENSGTLLKQVADLALLENGMLKGKDLADFIARSRELLK